MPNKRYTCRTHQGGIFSMPPRRGRPPVKCLPEFPCDRAKTIQVAGKPDFNSMSNADLKAYARENFSTIGKITSRAQMITAMEAQLAKQAFAGIEGTPKMPATPVKAPESVPKPRTAANDSLASAMAAKARLEAVGWTVKGRALIDDEGHHWAHIVASRDAETLLLDWENGILRTQDYQMESIRQSENGIPPHKLSFDPDELTDSELVRMVKGCKVTWWNTIAQSAETAVVGTGNIAIEHLFVGGGDTDNSKRIVKFLDHSGGGFRAFHVGALLKVG